MAHFAELDSDNKVIRVIVVENFPNVDTEGAAYLANTLGGRWQRTSYNDSVFFNYAGIGFTWDEQRQAFISPKPFPSWVLNETTCEWEAPVACPGTSLTHKWNEVTQTWDILTSLV